MTHGDTLISTLVAELVLAFALGAVANRPGPAPSSPGNALTTARARCRS